VPDWASCDANRDVWLEQRTVYDLGYRAVRSEETEPGEKSFIGLLAPPPQAACRGLPEN